MAWTGLVLTVDGQNALNSAQLSNQLSIKSIVVGDGNTPANFRTLKRLVHQLYEITELKIDVMNGRCTITADFPKREYNYYFREVGVIVITDEGDKLYVYDNCGDDAQYIVSTTGVEETKKRIRLSLNISDVAEITVSNPEILYVAYDDFEETRDKLKADIKNNADNLGEHINDYNNPHQVKAEQLGLDPTADMDKPVSTAQQAALDEQYAQLTAYTRQKIADLINGAPESMDTLKEVHDAITAHKTVMDALDAAIGKKASAAEFDTHTKDAVKHITSAERDKWNNSAHNYGACSTAAATAAKVVACTGFKLATGAEIAVKFTVTNTAANPTLNVNSTGAKPIYYRGAAISAGYLAANRTYSFRYNGTQWDLVGDINTDTNTTYSDMKGATASAAGTHGLVPAPAKGAQNSYLTGGATYQNVDDHAATFTSGDVADGNATAWTSVAKLASGETHKSILGKISNMFKNVRYLWKLIGSTDISKIGDGTVTGAIRSLNTGSLTLRNSIQDNSNANNITTTGIYELYYATSQTVVNFAFKNSSILEVVAGAGYIVQRQTGIDKCFTRYCDTVGKWSNWIQL